MESETGAGPWQPVEGDRVEGEGSLSLLETSLNLLTLRLTLAGVRQPGAERQRLPALWGLIGMR